MSQRHALLVSSVAFLALAAPAAPQEEGAQEEGAQEEGAQEEGGLKASTFSALELRGIGPALTSGRIGDFAVDPTDPARYFVAVASGGVWRTVNAGTTFEPVFDGEGSYSIGCVTLDPTNPNVVWVGTGENNSQRSVSCGRRRLPLARRRQELEERGAQGVRAHRHDRRRSARLRTWSTWPPRGRCGAPAGERGLYKTPTAARPGTQVLDISEDTGVNEVHLDPRDPDVLYASSYQRRRHVWTLINGGPESAIYKSTDARRDLAQARARGCPRSTWAASAWPSRRSTPTWSTPSSRPPRARAGFFRSTDRGESWEKRSDYVADSAAVLQRDRLRPAGRRPRLLPGHAAPAVTEDGGKTLQRRWATATATWTTTRCGSIPRDTDHLLVGCDGGIYESCDRGATLATSRRTCRSRSSTGSASTRRCPFYYVYGGTQDNNTPGRPVAHHERERHHQRRLVRHRRRRRLRDRGRPDRPEHRLHPVAVRRARALRPASGETVDIKPQRGARRAAARAGTGTRPLILSPHCPTRLYFAANRLFRSDDRGDSWTRDQRRPDARSIDRNQLEVMGRVRSVDAVAKNDSTSIYGNVVALERVAAGRRTALRRHRRRPGAGHRGRRRDLAHDRELPGRAGADLRELPRGLAARRATRSTPPSTTTRTATSSPTC